jgi:hypothetical protein
MIDDVPVNLPGHAVQFHRLRLVDSVEQGRESVAEAEASATSVTDVVDALQFLEQGFLVVKRVGLPVQRVPGRRLETALAAGRCIAAHGTLLKKCAGTAGLPGRQFPG